MKSTKPTEIKLLIFGGSTENAIMKNTSKKKINKSSRALWQGIHDIVYSKKVKRTILLVPY